MYFAASTYQKDQYRENYKKIVSLLELSGNKILNKSVVNLELKDFEKLSDENRIEYYKKVLQWISNSDIVIAEVSFPSTLNIGHEVTLALEKGKPVIGLYLKGKESASFKGIKLDKFVYQEYSLDNLEEVLNESLDYIQGVSDTRFNFLISPSLLEYLDWVAQHRKLPRSVYLRRLIEADMAKNRDYTPEK